MNHLRAGKSSQWAELDINASCVQCGRNKLPQGVMGLDKPKSCIGRNKSKYIAPNKNLLPS